MPILLWHVTCYHTTIYHTLTSHLPLTNNASTPLNIHMQPTLLESGFLPQRLLELEPEQPHQLNANCAECQSVIDIEGPKASSTVNWWHFSLDRAEGKRRLEEFRAALGTQ